MVADLSQLYAVGVQPVVEDVGSPLESVAPCGLGAMEQDRLARRSPAHC
jgi:hypothetical protein